MPLLPQNEPEVKSHSAKAVDKPRSRWTPELQARLVELAAQRLTARQIADELGVTKNTVIGRAYRTGVDLLPQSEAQFISYGGTLEAYPCGHPRTVENTYIGRISANVKYEVRHCRICALAYFKVRGAKRKERRKERIHAIAMDYGLSEVS